MCRLAVHVACDERCILRMLAQKGQLSPNMRGPLLQALNAPNVPSGAQFKAGPRPPKPNRYEVPTLVIPRPGLETEENMGLKAGTSLITGFPLLLALPHVEAHQCRLLRVGCDRLHPNEHNQEAWQVVQSIRPACLGISIQRPRDPSAGCLTATSAIGFPGFRGPGSLTTGSSCQMNSWVL